MAFDWVEPFSGEGVILFVLVVELSFLRVICWRRKDRGIKSLFESS